MRNLHQERLPSLWSSLPKLRCSHSHVWQCMLLIVTHCLDLLDQLWTYSVPMHLPSDCWTMTDPGCCHQTCLSLLAWPPQWVLAGKGNAPAAWCHPLLQLLSPTDSAVVFCKPSTGIDLVCCSASPQKLCFL